MVVCLVVLRLVVPRLSASSGVKLCTYQRWFARPAGSHCPSYRDIPMGTAKLQSVSDFVWGLICCPLSKAAICNCLGICVFAKCAVQAPWVMRGTCFWNAPPWQMSGSDLTAHCTVLRCHDQACMVQEPTAGHGQQVHHSMRSYGTRRAIDTQTLFHPFGFVGCQE